MRIKEKVAIVTGAGSGIGKATAIRFAKEGAFVACLDIKGADKTVLEINAIGGEAKSYQMNVASDVDWKTVVKELKDQFEKIDILVNIAGVFSPTDTVVGQSEEEWDRVLNVNLKGQWLGMKNVIPAMIENGGGKIVNIASVTAHYGTMDLAAYSASKGGIVALTRQAAIQYVRNNIRINAVSPGVIDTPMLGSNTPEMRAQYDSVTPVGRIGKPEEIASMVLFLSSDEADFITGQVYGVDGGWSAQ
jgi:NAD(P)-dependent dehydrogenase (short-subunit alcohol dehydrogenase family)